MKISCQSCQAKYTIADEKVVGKIVKIRCKKCGATIVINGNEDAAAAGANGAAAHGAVTDYTAQGDDQWTVNVAEGDQRTMSVHEIVQEYKSGVVTDDTYCWKDGMNDWLPLREIGDLYAACTLGPAPALHTSADGFSPISLAAQPPSMVASPPAPSTGEGDTVANVNFGLFGGASNGVEKTEVNGGSLFGSGSAPPPAAAASSATSTGSTAAARRQGGRATGNADLFGTAAQAGSESDVMTSAATANANNDASKMTGARNENSVLFSLTALTNEPAKPSGGGGGGSGRGETTAQGDGSGLIDIRALAQSMGVDDKNKGGNAKVDDIMNLSGGGAFSAALAAPVLAPPPADLSAFGTVDASGQPKNKTTLYAIIGGAVFLGLCILGAAFMFSGGKKDKEEDTKAAAPTTTETAPTATETTPTTTTTTETPQAAGTTVAQAPQTGSNTGATPPSTGASPGTQHTGGKSSGSSGHTGGTTAAAETPPPAPAAPSKPKSLAEAMNDAVPGGGARPSAPSGGGATAPFDRGAAAAALGGVNVQACKKPDGPTGPGKVRVTFEPNGSVSKVEFAEGSYAGTPVGGCILGKFRGAHIPAFSGGSVTAGKSFSVN